MRKYNAKQVVSFVFRINSHVKILVGASQHVLCMQVYHLRSPRVMNFQQSFSGSLPQKKSDEACIDGKIWKIRTLAMNKSCENTKQFSGFTKQ